MIPKALKKFMSDLLEATENKDVFWKEGAGPNAYYCAHKTYNLHLNYHFDEDAEVGVFGFRILKGSDDASFVVTTHEDDFNFMRNFQGAVSVNASNFDDIVSDFFDGPKI